MIGIWLSILIPATVGLCAVLVTFLLTGLPPRTTFPYEEISIAPPKKLKGSLKPNNLVESAERLYEGELHDLRNLVVHDRVIYATVRDGNEVVRLNGTGITIIGRIGFCDQNVLNQTVAIALDTLASNLIVADAYHGIYQVNLLDGHRRQLISRSVIPSGSKTSRVPRSFSSVAVSSTGDIYWTEASSDFYLHDGLFTVLANPSGRLIRYDRTTGTNTVLLDELYYANGVVLGPGEEYVLVSEGMSSRIRRYYLKGSKTGQSEIFVDRLPGFVSSSVTSDKEGIWMVVTDDGELASWPRLFARVPLLRRILAHTLALVELPIRVVNWFAPNGYSLQMLNYIGRLEMVPGGTAVDIVRLNWMGDIIATLRGATGDTRLASLGGDLYLGSKNFDHLRRIKNLARVKRDVASKRVAEPAPIHEKIVDDLPRPVEKKLRVIRKDGEQGEL